MRKSNWPSNSIVYYIGLLHIMKAVEHSIENWHIRCTEGGLATSTQNEELAEECHLFRAPTIIFKDNVLTISDKEGRITLTYNAKTALRYTNYEVRDKHYAPLDQPADLNSISYKPGKLEVKHAAHWKTLAKPKDI